jgi:hypothetical protein
MNGKITFLLGSGVTKPWGGKTTDEITENIFKSVDSIVNNNRKSKSIILKIKQIVEDHYIEWNYKPTFEDFLEILEFLIIFYRNKTLIDSPKFQPFFPLVFDVIKELDEIIEPNQCYNDSDDENFNKSFTLYEAYEDILRCVFSDVNKYIENINNGNSKHNEYFYRFLKLLSKDNTLRIYSINYDNLVRDLAKEIYFFNGFSCENEKSRFDLKKIITSDNINCFYNLHGSFYFDEDLTKSPESHLEIFYKKIRAVRPFSADALRNKLGFTGYNVISGSQKFLKTGRQPYSAFFNSFIQDCVLSNTMIIIGYSFNDYHVNNAINTFLQANERKKLIIITYYKPEDEIVFKNSLHAAFPGKTIDFPYQNESICKSKNSDFVIYKDGFENFLKNEEYQNIMTW